MAYVKQNFVDGNVLHASELNHMEDGIGDAYVKPSGGIPGADIAPNAVAAANIAQNAVSSMYYATLLAANWSEVAPGAGAYATEVAVNGLLATDNPIIDYAHDPTTQPDVVVAQLDAWNTVLIAAVPSNGLLDVLASALPDVDIPIKILCIRK